MYSVTGTHISYIRMRSSAGNSRKLKGPSRGISFVIYVMLSDSTLRFLRVLVTFFVAWTSSTVTGGTSHVVRDGMPLEGSETGSTTFVLVLAISNDVLHVAIG